MKYLEHYISRGQYRIYARDYGGEGPAIVLMHGFPDNLHLYDRIIPHLVPSRRTVTFDFLGWGKSDHPDGYPYTAANQTDDLDAVITQLKLGQVVLVAHDSSGPPAIDWALAHPERVASLVLLNTYYCSMPATRPPEAIILYSFPIIRNIAHFFTRIFPKLDRKLFFWQIGRFIRDDVVRKEVVPSLFNDFLVSRPAFLRLNEDLLHTLRDRRKMIPAMKKFARPVRIIFGDSDPYLNTGVALSLHELFPTSELILIPGARHYVQIDEPEVVARLIVHASELRSAA